MTTRTLLTYADFFPPADVATFKRVKRGQMQIARIGRRLVVDMLLAHGQTAEIPFAGHEYVRTEQGTFRLCMAPNSDNTTEQREHAAQGAKVVVMGDPDEIGDFFAAHGFRYQHGRQEFYRKLRQELNRPEATT